MSEIIEQQEESAIDALNRALEQENVELARSVELLSWYRKIESRYRDKAAVLVDRKGRVIVTNNIAANI